MRQRVTVLGLGMRLICQQKKRKIGSTKREHYARKIGSRGARAAPLGRPGIGPRREALGMQSGDAKHVIDDSISGISTCLLYNFHN